MSFIKFVFKLFFLLILAGSFLFSWYFFTDIKIRNKLKQECQGSTCPCFYNIVDYRLTKTQAKAFLLYIQNQKVRPETKIMEFTDFNDAKQIMEMFNICQLEQLKSVQQQENKKLQETERLQEIESKEEKREDAQ